VSEVRDIGALHTAAPDDAPAGRQLVATIGIDRYRHWRPLHNAVGDAEGAGALFRSLGFEDVAPPLLDDGATAEAINALVTDDLTALSADDSLVVFFAGHGGTRKQDIGPKSITTGYLIPVDGAADRVASWIEVDTWLRRIAKLPPRHILVILDACYSGIALAPIVRWGRNSGQLPALPFATLHSRPSRMVITSALNDEIALDSGPVPGHSLFTGCLIEALTGGAPSVHQGSGRRVTTGSDLGAYVRQRVQSYPGAPGWQQTPDFGVFDYDERGEMLIPLREDAVVPVRAAGSGSLEVASVDAAATIALPQPPALPVAAATVSPPPAVHADSDPPPRADGRRRAGLFAAVGAGVVVAIGALVYGSLARPSIVAQPPVQALAMSTAPHPVSLLGAHDGSTRGAIVAAPDAPRGGAALDAGAESPRVAGSGVQTTNTGSNPRVEVGAADPEKPVIGSARSNTGSAVRPTIKTAAATVQHTSVGVPPPALLGPTSSASAPAVDASTAAQDPSVPPTSATLNRDAPATAPDTKRPRAGWYKPKAIPDDQRLPPGTCGALVESLPTDAEILRDGQVVGHTPKIFAVPCNTTIDVTLRKAGFKGGVRTVTGISKPEEAPYFRLNRSH
jgi:hypothetical protein